MRSCATRARGDSGRSRGSRTCSSRRAGYGNYQQWITASKLEQQMSLEDYSVSNRGLRAAWSARRSRCGAAARRSRHAGVDLVLLQSSPQLRGDGAVCRAGNETCCPGIETAVQADAPRAKGKRPDQLRGGAGGLRRGCLHLMLQPTQCAARYRLASLRSLLFHVVFSRGWSRFVIETSLHRNAPQCVCG